MLAALQQEIAARLQADPFFEDTVVLWDQKGDVATEVARVEQELGWGVLVMTPTADTSLQNLPGIWFDDVKIVVQCIHVPDVALSSAPRALAIAERVAVMLTGWRPEACGNLLSPAKPTIAAAQTADPRAEGFDVRFTTQGGLSITVPQVATPVATLSAGMVTITCATAGAAVFRSTNGRPPIPRTGTLCTGAFAAPASGTVIKARAWLAGYLPSDPVSLLIP